MRVYVMDNYDSFVYNLVHCLKELKVDDIRIVKNDQVDLEEIRSFDKILLSPGPGIPKEAGQMMEVLGRYYTSHSILGVCLGHQAIGEYFGWELKQLEEPLHGVTSRLNIVDRQCLFRGLKDGSIIGHYHSWVLNEREPTSLRITATNQNKQIMALRHQEYKVYGLQFHPESILTENGKEMLHNWLKL